ncbi:hypothetical protein [Bacillus subtilis]|uniref:hypothetical protein n=1 Tax=Bacillus subtilis TaxID=1423 RepID=UPI000BD10DEA|nr:hypothetical protein CIK44_04125 [Bacillus sp. X2(2017)]
MARTAINGPENVEKPLGCLAHYGAGNYGQASMQRHTIECDRVREHETNPIEVAYRTSIVCKKVMAGESLAIARQNWKPQTSL